MDDLFRDDLNEETKENENATPLGESADIAYDEPCYDDADYDDEYYDDEYYDDEYYDDYPDSEYPDDAYPDDAYPNDVYADDAYPNDVYADDAYPNNAYPESSSDPEGGPISAGHSCDISGMEDERPVYGSYYEKNAAAASGSSPAAPAGENSGETGQSLPSDEESREPYQSKYDSYRFVTPGAPFAEKSHPEKTRAKSPDDAKKAEGRKGGLLGRILATALYAAIFGLIASAVFLGVLKMTGYTAPQKKTEPEIAEAVPSPVPSLDKEESKVTVGKADTADMTASQDVELTVPEVVEMCMPAMVAITNTTVQQYYDFFGGASERQNVSVGSGIIVGETDTELLIATNNHVISNSSEITVTFINDGAVAGLVKGTDADNDLAIVAVKLEDINDETKEAIRVISIGDSESLAVGETVVAIGNALGYGQSVSRGVISALNREVTVDGMVHQLIQTDASINPGNSGGALLNMRGELIGINEIKYVNTDVEGVGYAIPMATAKPILDSLGGKPARTIVDDEHASYIGIMCIDVPSYYVQSGYPSGVYVSELTKGGPAEKAGLKEGDIITAMDGISISTTSQLITYLRYYAAGEEIDFTVSRLNEDETKYEKVKIKITLGYRKDSDIDESKKQGDESTPEEGAQNGGFDVIPDQKR